MRTIVNIFKDQPFYFTYMFSVTNPINRVYSRTIQIIASTQGVYDIITFLLYRRYRYPDNTYWILRHHYWQQLIKTLVRKTIC